MIKASSSLSKQKGIALLIVLTSVLITALLANIIFTIILNQNRLTKHRVSRMQAYYAAQLGVVYALDMLSSGHWPFSPGTYYIKRGATDCGVDPNCVRESELPNTIKNITINLQLEPSGTINLINITSIANYTYNSPP
jgi:Tfp pilus assembly protein PilX